MATDPNARVHDRDELWAVALRGDSAPGITDAERMSLAMSPSKRVGIVASFAILSVIAYKLVWSGIPHSPLSEPLHAAPAPDRAQPSAVAIEHIQLGDRVVGTNPLREQVDDSEPDPATWRTVGLEMKKEGGRSLWIELLRPHEWVEDNGVATGRTIFLSLPEMGAIGDAEVTSVGPCPPIQSGSGTIVTGKFVHEADAGSGVVRLQLEGQDEATVVTSSHPYWSVDRLEFVDVGRLRVGELIDTEFGPRHVESIAADLDYDGLLHNIETTEHVYRVGSVGTLVHNSCVIYGYPQFTSAAHAKAMQDMASRMAKSGAYTEVYMHSKWSTILQGKGVSVSPNQLPDVAGIRLNGKIDIIEFASSARDHKYGNLLGRNRDVWNQLPPHLRGDILVYDELGNWTHVFP